jgi:putative transposase
MARQVRIQYEGAVYHVMARGDRRESIIGGDKDRWMCIETLGEAWQKTGWLVDAWVVLSNQYHLVLRTPQPNLVAGMRWLQNTYTRRFNVRNQLWGQVFGGRYKAVLVQSREFGSGDYLSNLIDYVHLNPIRAGILNGTSQILIDYGPV